MDTDANKAMLDRIQAMEAMLQQKEEEIEHQRLKNEEELQAEKRLRRQRDEELEALKSNKLPPSIFISRGSNGKCYFILYI